MSIQKKSLTNKNSLSLSDSLSKNKLIEEQKYLVEIHVPFKSVNIPLAHVTNFIDFKTDKDIVYQIRQIISLVGTEIELSKLPIRPPLDEKNYYLMNDPNDLQQKIRFGSLKNTVGFLENIEDIAKYQFDHDFHRVLVHIEKEDIHKIKIVFFDPFHHVALGLQGRQELYWNYKKCSGEQGKKDCISQLLLSST